MIVRLEGSAKFRMGLHVENRRVGLGWFLSCQKSSQTLNFPRTAALDSFGWAALKTSQVATKGWSEAAFAEVVFNALFRDSIRSGFMQV